MDTRTASIGKASRIKPGELAAFDAGGTPIAIANVGGRYYEIVEMCTHEQCSLVAEGTLDGTVLTCGCHGAQFDVTTGQVLAPPAVEPLKVYPLEVNGDDLMIEV